MAHVDLALSDLTDPGRLAGSFPGSLDLWAYPVSVAAEACLLVDAAGVALVRAAQDVGAPAHFQRLDERREGPGAVLAELGGKLLVVRISLRAVLPTFASEVNRPAHALKAWQVCAFGLVSPARKMPHSDAKAVEEVG